MKMNFNTLLILGVVTFGTLAFISARRAAADTGRAIIDATNPLNRENIFNRAANGLTRAISGDPHQTVGGAVFDLLNPTQGLDDD